MGLAQRYELSVEADQGSLDLEQLVSLIAAQDEPAVTHFRESTNGLLFGLLLLILGDTARADEVLSEVYNEVRENAGHFNKNHESLLTWLITITHRRALEHLCSGREDRELGVSLGLPGVLGSGHFGISKAEHRRLVRASLGALSPLEQKLIELAYFFRMSPPAIAQRLHQSPAAVTAGLQCGISQLYNLFKTRDLTSESKGVVV